MHVVVAKRMSELVHSKQAAQIARVVVVGVEQDRSADDAAIDAGGAAAEADRALKTPETAVAADDDLARARKPCSLSDWNHLTANRGELTVSAVGQKVEGSRQVGLERLGLGVGHPFGGR